MNETRKFRDMVTYKQENYLINGNEFFDNIKSLLEEIDNKRQMISASENNPKDYNIWIDIHLEKKFTERKFNNDAQREAVMNFIENIAGTSKDSLKVTYTIEHIGPFPPFKLIRAITQKHEGFGYPALLKEMEEIKINIVNAVKKTKRDSKNIVEFKDEKVAKSFEYFCEYYSFKSKDISQNTDYAAGKIKTRRYYLDDSSFQKLSYMYQEQMKSKSSGCCSIL